MLEITFWTLLVLVAYVYAGYPVLLFILAHLNRPRKSDLVENAGDPPTISLLISAFNEEDCIAEKLENSLALNYPADRINIVVISDASDDQTDSIVDGFAEQNISLLRMTERGGKTLGLNAAIERSVADVIVFSDANAHYQSDAVKALAAPFTDASVGAVVGESSYVDADSGSGQSESLYWRYETAIKYWESATGSVVGGDGAIYAVRRALYRPMAAADLSDFVNPLEVVRAGSRCVYEPAALSYEDTADNYSKEYRRKVRIVNRAWRALWKMRGMLNPIHFGYFSLKLWSHKVLRWLVPVFLGALLFLNLILFTKAAVYAVTLMAQLVFYASAFIGYTRRRRHEQPAAFRIPYYFCLVNFAAAVGLIELMSGKTYTTWKTART